MSTHIPAKAARLALCLGSALTLAACAGIQEKLAYLGKPPPLSAIENPYTQKGYKPVALPMPPQVAANTSANALWQPGRQTFFKDQRAHQVGDILTIMITIADEAKLKNKTTRSRVGNETQGLSNFLGLETQLQKVLPDAVDPSKLVGMNSDSNSEGDGKIERKEDVKLKMAAMITQVLPNGNFVLRGNQEVRINFELRQLSLSGVIRPEDILNNNSISYEKIAEARISYGGAGELSDIQQPRYGEQFFDSVMPF